MKSFESVEGQFSLEDLDFLKGLGISGVPLAADTDAPEIQAEDKPDQQKKSHQDSHQKP